MERMTIAALMLCWIFAMPAQAQLTLAPDGTYVGGRTPTLAPDGTHCWWCQTKNQ